MPYFNKFDICEAWYLYAVHSHNGQWSKEYKILGRLINMNFRPSPMLAARCDLTVNGAEIYDNLVSGNSTINP